MRRPLSVLPLACALAVATGRHAVPSGAQGAAVRLPDASARTVGLDREVAPHACAPNPTAMHAR